MRNFRLGFGPLWLLLVLPSGDAAGGQEQAKTPPAPYSGWNLLAVPVKDAGHGADSPDRAPATTPMRESRGRWIYVDGAPSGAAGSWILGREIESWSVDSSTAAAPGWQFFSVARATPYGELRFSRVYRWDDSKADYVLLGDGDVLQPGVGYFGHQEKADVSPPVASEAKRAAETDFGDNIIEAALTGTVAGRFADPLEALGRVVPPPGAFVPAEVLYTPHGSASQVDVALSGFDGGTYAHVVHVVRGQGAGDQVWYHRSEKAGKAGTFESSQTGTAPGSSSSVISVSIAARENRVSIVWIERLESPEEASTDGARFRVLRTESQDSGRTFGPMEIARSNNAWKRGVDTAYDAMLGHHLVWGEANKVYYLRDLTGEASNVFDVLKRTPATEVVKYLAKYEPDDAGQCACPDCWCEESHIARHDADPEDNTATEYLFRNEESYVYEPSLHVDAKTVSIVARQKRMWDNKPVGHEAWAEMFLEPVYSETVVERLRPTRFLVGYQSTWKESYEPGDELLFLGLGIQHQYRYRGTWHEQDKIRLAQRPLVPNAWSTSTAGIEEGAPGVSPWRRDSWQDDAFQSWRLSTLAWVGTEGGDDTPSHPVIAGAPWGLVVAYEDGPSDNPNAVGSNPIQLQVSVDGGRSWSEPRRVATGYKPALAVSDGGDVVVSNYEPHALDGGAISVVQSNDSATSFGGSTHLSKGPAKPIHWKSHGRGADALVGGGSLGAFEDLFFAAWIEQSDQREARDRIVFSRASRASEVARYGVDLPEYVTEGRADQVRVTAENKYHMRVASSARLQLTNLAGGPAPGGPKHAPTSVAAPLAPPATSPRTISLVGGEASLPLDLFDGAVVGDAGMVSLAVAAVPGAQGDAESAGVEVSVVPAFAASVHGNYQQALWLRDKLWRQGTDDDSSVGFQVEYEAVGDDKDASDGLRGIEEGQAIDSVPLASHERVWAYTQGIALAQYSRQGTNESLARARALARYLCSQAKVAPSGKKGFRDLIQGWPFSWNTLDDNWRDVRLVTGATAWVTHGLGVFVVSEAFSGLSDDEQKRIRACYRQALHGLIGHRHSGSMEDGRRISLVTAGWTTLGLAHADDPSALLQTGWRRTEDHLAGETWHYYDVLDALGYDNFDETRAPAVRRTMEGGHSPSSLPPLVLTKRDFAHLKQKVEATNIVTEHNLDVLSVLNHALNHQEALSLQEPGRPELSTIRAWRDELRAGIFHVLWDDVEDHWRHDLENAALSEGAGARKRTEIQAALVRGDWGRVATGGVLASESEYKEAVDAVLIDDGFFRGRFTVIPNRRHTAIDNCSWLSLSVDFDDLTNADEVEQLARCLEFTTLAFAKDIEFEGQRYYGAHYFFDGFEDKYIEGTSRQEQSFHLEATTGLILGLLAFVEAHPEHPKRDFFVREAYALWAGVQAFVLDHGFPYSSQRIINLSTLLTSSTALIWFIDVYEHFERLGPAVTENNPWLEAHPSCEARYGIGCPPPPTKLSSTKENPTSGFLLRTLGDEARLTEVSDDSIELDLPQFVELEEDPNLLWLLTQDSNAVARLREPISLHDIDDQRVVVLRLSKEEGATGVDVVRTYNLTILGGGPFSQVPSGYRDTSFELRHIAENSTKIRVQCRNLHAGLPLELGGPGTVRMPEGVGGSVMVEAPGPDPSDAVEGATLVSLHCRLEVTGPANEHVYLGFNHLQINKPSSASAGPGDDIPCVGHCDVVEQNPVLRAAIIAMGYFTSANCHRWKDHYLAGFKDRFPSLRVSLQLPLEICGFGLDTLMIFFDRQTATIYALEEGEVYRAARHGATPQVSWEDGEDPQTLAPVGAIVPGASLMIAGADPRLVQQNLLMEILFGAGVRAAGSQGGKAAGGTLAKEIIAGWLSGAAGLGLPVEELQPLADELLFALGVLAPESHNILVIPRGTPFSGVPDTFDPVQMPYPLRTQDLLVMSPAELHHHMTEVFQEESVRHLQKLLGKHTNPASLSVSSRDEGALAEFVRFVDSTWRGHIPQTVVIQDTGRGIHVYQRFPSEAELISPEFAPAGLVAVMQPDGSVSVPYKRIGTGFDWTPQGTDALSAGLLPEQKSAFNRLVASFVAELLLGSASPADAEKRIEEIKEDVITHFPPDAPKTSTQNAMAEAAEWLSLQRDPWLGLLHMVEPPDPAFWSLHGYLRPSEVPELVTLLLNESAGFQRPFSVAWLDDVSAIESVAIESNRLYGVVIPDLVQTEVPVSFGSPSPSFDLNSPVPVYTLTPASPTAFDARFNEVYKDHSGWLGAQELAKLLDEAARPAFLRWMRQLIVGVPRRQSGEGPILLGDNDLPVNTAFSWPKISFRRSPPDGFFEPTETEASKTNSKVRLLPFERIPGAPQMIVQATVNGIPMRFVVDNGAPVSILSPEALAQLNEDDDYTSTDFRVKHHGFHKFSGKSHVARLKNVVIGDRAFDSFPVSILSMPELEKYHVDGILGWPFLSLQVLYVDSVGKSIGFFPKDAIATAQLPISGFTAIPIEVEDESIRLPIRVATGTELRAQLDFGLAGTLISEKFVPDAKNDGRAQSRVGEIEVFPHRMQRMEIGAWVIEPADVLVAPDGPMLRDGRKPTMYIGINQFRGQEIILDIPNEVLYVKETDTPFFDPVDMAPTEVIKAYRALSDSEKQDFVANASGLVALHLRNKLLDGALIEFESHRNSLGRSGSLNPSIFATRNDSREDVDPDEDDEAPVLKFDQGVRFEKEVEAWSKKTLEKGLSTKVKARRGRIVDGWNLDDPLMRLISAYEWTVELEDGQILRYIWWEPGIVPGTTDKEIADNYHSLTESLQARWYKIATPEEKQRIDNAIKATR